MQIDLWHVILLGLAFILIACFRYISMVGAYYLVVYKLFKNRLKRFKINQEFPEKEMVVQESKWALLNKINFGSDPKILIVEKIPFFPQRSSNLINLNELS